MQVGLPGSQVADAGRGEGGDADSEVKGSRKRFETFSVAKRNEFERARAAVSTNVPLCVLKEISPRVPL